MAPHKYTFNVSMSCGGCSSAIDRVLKKKSEVDSYRISLDEQTVEIVSSDPFPAVYAMLAKIGKPVNSATVDGQDTPLP